MTILIVEDEAAIRVMLGEILEDEGYAVACVTNGLEALTYLQQGNQTGLILLDLNMPVMNGWEFRERQQRDPTLETIPVILVSALPSLDQKVATLKAAAYLTKPVEIDSLLDTVAQYYH